jgi:hypothetical protein
VTTTGGRGRRRGRWAALIALVALTALGVVAWHTGAAGWAAGRLLPRLLLPLRLSSGFLIETCGYERPFPELPAGAVLTVRPELVDAAARSGSRWARRLIPPHTFRDGMHLSGSWTPPDDGLQPPRPVRLALHLDAAAPRPRLEGSLPEREFNRLASHFLADDLEDKEEYLFGDYTLAYKPWFKEVEVLSDPCAAPASEVQSRRLAIRTAGRVKLRMEDGPLKITAEGRVSRLAGTCTLSATNLPDGLRMAYRFDVQHLDMTIGNMPTWIEKQVAKKLRESMQRSLNREKKRARFAMRRWPHWLPLDLEVRLLLEPEAP